MKKKILFIHHSTGALLLFFGRIRKLLKDECPNLELWDHAYNLYPLKIMSYLVGPFTFRTGLSDGNGMMVGRDFDIATSNDSPKEYAEIFSRAKSDNTLSKILDFDVVIFKNCFPTSRIETGKKLAQFKQYYDRIMLNLSRYSNQFVIFTPPPLRAEMNNQNWANNARALSAHIIKTARLYKNISVFDFFGLLSDDSEGNINMLKRSYCSLLPIDSHPNIRANMEIGKKFVEFIAKYA